MKRVSSSMFRRAERAELRMIAASTNLPNPNVAPAPPLTATLLAIASK